MTMKKIIALLLLAIPSSAYAAVTPPWSTTLNCADWTQSTGSANLSCDGLVLSNWPYSCSGSSNTLSKIETAGNNPGGGGGKGFRVATGDGENNMAASIEVELTTPVPELWIRVYQRWPLGFQWNTFNAMKLFYISTTGHPAAAYVNEQMGTTACAGVEMYMQNISPSGHHVETHETCDGTGSSYALPCYGMATILGSPNGTGDGVFHAYEMHLKTNSPGQSNGIFQMYIDGVLRNDHREINWAGENFTKISIHSNQRTPANGTCLFADYDDIAVSTTGYIGLVGGGGGGGGGGGDTTPPTLPTNLSATAISSSQINLAWTASTDAVGVTGYNVYRGGVLIGTSAANTYSDTGGLAPSTTYTYTASARDAAGNTSAQSSSSSAVTQSASAQATILFEGWESGNTLNWRADYVAGGTTVGTASSSNSVYDGVYSARMPASDPGNYVFAFGDSSLRSGGPTTQVTDFTLEEYYRPSTPWQWDGADLKMWLVNAFDSWGAGYTLAAGQSKPNTWAAYYMTISTNSSGQPFGQMTRADGLGMAGDLWHNYWQNVGSPVALVPGTWNKFKFRLKLNTPGLSDGIFQLWINDVLKCDYSNMNYRGTYTSKGWNHLMMSIHANNGLPATQYINRDHITLSIGGSGGGGLPIPMFPIGVIVR